MFQIVGFAESPSIVKWVFTAPNLHWIVEMILQASHLQQNSTAIMPSSVPL